MDAPDSSDLTDGWSRDPVKDDCATDPDPEAEDAFTKAKTLYIEEVIEICSGESKSFPRMPREEADKLPRGVELIKFRRS